MSFYRVPARMSQVQDEAVAKKTINGLQFSETFSKPYKFIFACLGISFGKKKMIHWIVILILVFRAILNAITFIVLPGPQKSDLFSFVTSEAVFFCPAVMYAFIFTRVGRFNELLDKFFLVNRIAVNNSSALTRSIRKMNIASVVVIMTEYLAHITMGYLTTGDSNNWIVNQFVPIDLGLNPYVKLTLALSLFFFDAISMSFVPIMMSLYMSYNYSLDQFKISALNMINARQFHQLTNFVSSLDEIMDTFESYFSFIPFSCLLYCGGPNLCFILSTHEHGDDGLKSAAQVFLAISCFNILLLLSLLFISSFWQENIDKKIASINRKIAFTGEPQPTHQLQESLNALKRRPTIWFIFPIDRPLILSCIGSAITFSTLFIQLGKQK